MEYLTINEILLNSSSLIEFSIKRNHVVVEEILSTKTKHDQNSSPMPGSVIKLGLVVKVGDCVTSVTKGDFIHYFGNYISVVEVSNSIGSMPIKYGIVSETEIISNVPDSLALETSLDYIDNRIEASKSF